MKVKATKRGFIGGRLVRIGESFECSKELFSKKWMVEDKGKKSKAKPEKSVVVEQKPLSAYHNDLIG